MTSDSNSIRSDQRSILQILKLGEELCGLTVGWSSRKQSTQDHADDDFQQRHEMELSKNTLEEFYLNFG